MSADENSNGLKLLTYFLWVTIPFSVLYAAVCWAIGLTSGMYCMLVASVLHVGNLVYVRRRCSYSLASNLYVFATCFLAMGGVTLLSGGFQSPVLPWFAAAGPVAAIFLLGFNRQAKVWSAIFVL